VVVFLSAIPITIGMNSLRVALIGVTVNLWGPSMAEGFVHEFEGWVVFSLCAVLLLTEAWLLMRGHAGVAATGHFRLELFSRPQRPLLASLVPITASVGAFVAISAGLAVIFGSGIIEEREQVIPQHPPFSTFPVILGDWRGEEQGLPPAILESLNLSDYWIADYRPTREATPVNLYIAWYDSQRIGSSTHSPSNCIPGGGWQVASKSITPVTLDNGNIIHVTRMVIRREGVKQLVYFWFDERGRNITETTWAKWYLLTDSIALHRTDGALIRLVTPLEKDETEENGDKRLQSFLSTATPALQQFIPGRNLPSIESSQP
jgi:exosortase D (VPLPA-CTERM-specific)